jgi:hypothetical protein
MKPGEVKPLEDVMPEKQPLVARLAEVVKAVERIAKNGRNEHHKYDYVTESDMVEALRNELANRGIMMIPFVDKATTEKTEKGLMATVEVSYKVTDGSESVTVRTAGSGYDIPGDKAIYKALTGALKYALRQLFLIPTGDDPERDEKDHGDDSSSSRRPSDRPISQASAPAKSATPARQNPTGDGPAGTATVKFGKNKGKALSELDEAGLVWWTKVCEESVGKQDPKWHEKNVAALDACQAEWARRQPWRECYQMCVAIGQQHGLDEDGVKEVLKNNLGITTADKLTEADVTRFQEAVVAE